jgi:hypothetical protein
MHEARRQPVVEFAARATWALLPLPAERKRAPEPPPDQAFRWLGSRRIPERCGPSQMAAQLGWVVRSPMNVTVGPLTQIEIATDDGDELQELSLVLPSHELWRREDGYLAVPRPNWLRLYQARFGTGWEATFVPNGQGTFEWHLGWTMTIPQGYAVLVMGHEQCALDVPMGVLREPVIARLNQGHGQAIAIRPSAEISIRRGDPIARLVLLHPDSLGYARAETEAGLGGLHERERQPVRQFSDLGPRMKSPPSSSSSTGRGSESAEVA